MSNNSSSFGFQSGAPSAPSAPSTPSVPGQGVSQFGQGMTNFGNTLNQNGANPVGNWFGQMGNNISNFGQGMPQVQNGMGRLGDIIARGGSGWINAFGHGGNGWRHGTNQQTPNVAVNPATNPVSTTPVASPGLQAPTVTPETSDMQGSPIYQAWLNAKQYNNNFNGFNDKYQQLQQMLTQNNPGWTQAEIDRNTINSLGGYLLNGQY